MKAILYDYRKPQPSWTFSKGWSPEINRVHGIKLEPDANLTKYVVNETLNFSSGTIRCEVLLENNAIFDLIFRGKIGAPFYMARLDTRPFPGYGDIYDCILVSSKGDMGWDVCNKTKGELSHTTPVNEWVNMELVCTQKSAVLFVNGYQVDVITNLGYGNKVSHITIFTEQANGYVRNLQIMHNN